MTKIDIISGFLGAGKTTLIKKLLKEGYQKEKVVLIENEFGEIGIDGGFLKDAGIKITEMNSGCICCSLVGDFKKALTEVLSQYHPDRIIIEPSGVGKLSDVIKAVQNGLSDQVILNSYITVVDVKKCKMYLKNFGEFFINQIETAKTIVFSRTQSATEDKLNAAIAMVKEHNDHATMITTPWDQITGEQILAAMEEKNTFFDDVLQETLEGHNSLECDHHHDHTDHDTCCSDHEGHHHDHHSHHHADEVFTSWGMETVKVYDREELNAVLHELSEREDLGLILRAKGIVAGDGDEWLQFDFVPGEFEVRKGNPDVTGRICVIGSKLEVEKIEHLFA